MYPVQRVGFIFICVTAFLFALGAIQKRDIIKSSIYTTLTINVFAAAFFYPQLLAYQEGSEVGKRITRDKVPANQFFVFQFDASSSLNFYANRIVQRKDKVEEVNLDDVFLTNEKGLQTLQDYGFDLEYMETGNTFSVSNLTPQFLNEKTRQEVVGQYFLIKIKGLLETEEEAAEKENKE